MPPIRAWRKRRQIENVLGPLAELTALLERPAHIVDFCASSGHVALPAAAVLEGVTVEINDLRERPIHIARERIAEILLRDDDAAGARGERRDPRRARRFAAAGEDVHGDAQGGHLGGLRKA